MQLIGTTLGGKYELTKLLGEGGLGQVYLAQQQPIGRPVAVKLLHPELADNERVTVRFEREALAASRITHPSVVTIYDFGAEPLSDGVRLYLVMEYLSGRTLFDKLQAQGTFSPKEAVSVLSQILLPLEACHEAGIVHRDLKPDNVMLCPSPEGERVKLLDFGVAKMLFAEGPSVTRSGQAVGTPYYMAPEQIGQNKQLGPQADLYAVGVMLYELLVGVAPFVAENHLEVFRQHFYDPPPALPPRLAPFSSVLERAMAKLPGERHASARELKQELHTALAVFEAHQGRDESEEDSSDEGERTRVDIRSPWSLDAVEANDLAVAETVPMAAIPAPVLELGDERTELFVKAPPREPEKPSPGKEDANVFKRAGRWLRSLLRREKREKVALPCP